MLRLKLFLLLLWSFFSYPWLSAFNNKCYCHIRKKLTHELWNCLVVVKLGHITLNQQDWKAGKHYWKFLGRIEDQVCKEEKMLSDFFSHNISARQHPNFIILDPTPIVNGILWEVVLKLFSQDIAKTNFHVHPLSICL